MILRKRYIFIGAIALSASAIADPMCGFDVPSNMFFVLDKSDQCSANIRGKKNYAGMDYLNFYKHGGIKKLLGRESFFYQEDGKNFFVSESADDPKVTVKPLQQEAASPIAFNGLSGFSAESTFFVQVLPDAGSRESPYSLKVQCTTIAVGDQDKALKARFCVPDTSAGKKQLIQYKEFLTAVRPL